MKRLLLVLFVMTCTTWAMAQSLESIAPPTGTKGSGHVLKIPGEPDGREGGETIATAFPIAALPFTDSGNICDNINDYEEVCPYGSTSPDVVYAYTPAVNQTITINLCSEGNHYDTKVFVYENGWTPGTPFACNDDACSNSWTSYASLIQYLDIYAGNTYYIVVDGYGGDCGDYELNVSEDAIPDVECFPEAVAEGEPPLGPGYEDNWNGGCNTSPSYPFQTFDWIHADDADGCGWLCGVSGWYDGTSRDTDWFTAIASGYQVDLTVTAEYETYIFFLAPLDCATVGVDISALCAPGVTTTLSYATVPGQEVWMWVGPTIYDGPQIEYDYSMRVCGIVYETIPVENQSWGCIKSMFR